MCIYIKNYFFQIFLPGSSLKELTLVDINKKYCFRISWKDKYINLQADNGDELNDWLSCLSPYLNEKIIVANELEKLSRGRNSSWKNWKKRYIILSCDEISYFHPSTFEPLGSVFINF